jgi:hypothetical protein
VIVVHNSQRIPIMQERWDPKDEAWLAFDYGPESGGLAIVQTEWHLPDGWEITQQLMGVRVTDSNGYTSPTPHAVLALLKCDGPEGRYKLETTVRFADGSQMNRAVIAVVADI